MDTEKRLRDFVYLDVDRLYSLYSQVFEGVADQIVQSYAAALSNESAQKGALLSGSSTESNTIEISRRTENKVLYDHIYTLLETRLEPAIIDAGRNISLSTIGSVHSGTYVKASGPVVIADFSRMKVLFEQFNRLGEAIAYSATISEEGKAARAAEDEALSKIADRNQRAQAKARLEQHRDPKRLAKEFGLAQDEQLLKNLVLMSDMFYSEGFDVTILSDDRGLAYRAVVDRRWLRIAPTLLRAQYGGSSVGPWTVVGQVTHVPGTAPREGESAPVPTKSGAVEMPSMRDPFMVVFESALGLERMFLESNRRAEIVVCPLAIYREVTLKLS